jgi:hypothetical protein
MSGKVPPSSRAGARNPRRTDVQKAADLYERFTGHKAEPVGVANLPPLPDVVMVIGECDGVLYTTVRDGRKERYIHEFANSDKPLLCVAPDGKQMLFVGGRYVFTERGIVDLSDKKNLPKGYR